MPVSRSLSRQGSRQRESGFEEILTTHWDGLWKQACHLCNGNIHDAGDLLSDGMIEAFRAFDRYRGPSFDRWFFGILRFNHLDNVRNRKRHPVVSIDESGDRGGVFEIADSVWNPERRLMEREYTERLKEAVENLGPEFGTVLLLCDVDQLEYREIAQVLGLPIGTVRSRVHRARSRVRHSLETQVERVGEVRR